MGKMNEIWKKIMNILDLNLRFTSGSNIKKQFQNDKFGNEWDIKGDSNQSPGKTARHLSLNLQAFCKALGGDRGRPWLLSVWWERPATVASRFYIKKKRSDPPRHWRQESFLSKIISRAQAPYHLAQNVTKIALKVWHAASWYCLGMRSEFH